MTNMCVRNMNKETIVIIVSQFIINIYMTTNCNVKDLLNKNNSFTTITDVWYISPQKHELSRFLLIKCCRKHLNEIFEFLCRLKCDAQRHTKSNSYVKYLQCFVWFVNIQFNSNPDFFFCFCFPYFLFYVIEWMIKLVTFKFTIK